jgi:pyruvate dehydrogenase E2 component (dihydrolipoamide acetyltransferase)
MSAGLTEFHLPSLGADMDEATVVEWKVKPGDRVKRGDILLAVETYKGVIDVEVFDEGVIESIKVPAGEKVPVGTVLAVLSGGAGAAPTPPAAPETAPPVAAPSAPPTRPHISPVARKRAEQMGVSLEGIEGSGPDGSITLEDVWRAAAQPFARKPAAPAGDMRSVIAAAMTRSKREIPHYYLGTTIDLKRASDWLAARNAARPVTERLLYSALLVKAVALALREWPELNGYWKEGRFQPGAGIHIGIAISLRQGGLVAPALRDADGKDLDGLMRALHELVTRARSGRLRASEMSDATITITNLGERGVETVYPVIYPPQVAMVGFGAVVKRPVVTVGDAIEAHPLVQASLAADHRVSDGHRGGLFLTAIDRLLQEPDKL